MRDKDDARVPGDARESGEPGESDELGEPGELGDQDADPAAAARTICLQLLATRARTRSELASALAKRDVPDGVATAVLDRFVELGFVDDAAFAKAWVASRQAGRGLAGRALAHELRTKGVPDDVVRTALAAVDPEAELAKARELVGRRLAGMSGVPLQTRYRRLSGLLARKGYSGTVAARAIKEALADALADALPDQEDD